MRRLDRSFAAVVRLSFAVFVSLLAITPATVFAQASAAPPEPRVSRVYPVFVGYLFMFLMVAIIVGISLMPSKRAHQD